MARKPIIAGNWKLNMLKADAEALAKGVVAAVGTKNDVDVVLCPTFTALDTVAKTIAGSKVAMGAQDCYWEEKGAFTGEIAPSMLKDAGCTFVIIGHSERRQYFGETDATINKKAKALYAAGLTPIICVGETLEEREACKMQAVIETQVRGTLAGLEADKVAASVLAYEPVWAIGTGKTASKEQAQEVHAIIRKLVAELFGQAVADAVRIQYGGSVKAENAAELMAQPDIDGALVGGAALKADSFAGIINF